MTRHHYPSAIFARILTAIHTHMQVAALHGPPTLLTGNAQQGQGSGRQCGRKVSGRSVSWVSARSTRLLVARDHVRELAVKGALLKQAQKAPAQRKGKAGAPGKGPVLGEV